MPKNKTNRGVNTLFTIYMLYDESTKNYVYNGNNVGFKSAHAARIARKHLKVVNPKDVIVIEVDLKLEKFFYVHE